MLKDFDGTDTLCIGGNWGFGWEHCEKKIGIIGIKELGDGKLFVGLAHYLDQEEWAMAKHWEENTRAYSLGGTPEISVFVADDERNPGVTPYTHEEKRKWPEGFIQTVGKHLEWNAEYLLLGSNQKSFYRDLRGGKNHIRLSGSVDERSGKCGDFHLSIGSYGHDIDPTGIGTKNDIILDPTEKDSSGREKNHPPYLEAFMRVMREGFAAAVQAGQAVRLNWADIQPRVITPEEIQGALPMNGLADYLGMLGVPHTIAIAPPEAPPAATMSGM